MCFDESFGFIINRSSDEDNPVCWDMFWHSFSVQCINITLS
jgi:hypothetical protein